MLSVKKNSSGIYKITNLINGKVYIGSTTKLLHRWSEHKYALLRNKHTNTKLQHSFNKYGLDNFSFSILLYCKLEDLVFYEQRAIDKYNVLKEGYNCRLLVHSNLGCKRSEESKLKMRLAKLGKKREPHSEETKRKISEANTGKIRSEEARKKSGLSRKGKKNKTPFSKETREKMSRARLGKPMSESTKQKLSIINTGNIPSEETKNKLSKSITEWHKIRKALLEAKNVR